MSPHVMAAMLVAAILTVPYPASAQGTSPFGKNRATGENQSAAPWSANAVLEAWREKRLQGEGSPGTPNDAHYRDYGFGKPVTTEKMVVYTDRAVAQAKGEIEKVEDRKHDQMMGVFGDKLAGIWPWVWGSLLLGLLALIVGFIGWFLPRVLGHPAPVPAPAPTPAPVVTPTPAPAPAPNGHGYTGNGCGHYAPSHCQPAQYCPPPTAYACPTADRYAGSMPRDDRHNGVRGQFADMKKDISGLKKAQAAMGSQMAGIRKEVSAHGRSIGGIRQDISKVVSLLTQRDGQLEKLIEGQRAERERRQQQLASLR